MELTESSWLLVKNTNNVIGFIGGSSGKPSPITQREVDKIMARVQEGADSLIDLLYQLPLQLRS
jgi:transcriptional antiterminator NusG